MDGRNYSFEAEEHGKRPTKRKILYCLAVVVVGGCLGTLLFWLINGKSFTVYGGGGTDSDTCSSVSDSEKFNCHPDNPISEKECLKRGCCFIPASDLSVQDMDLINSSYLGVPSCFYPSSYKGYEISQIEKNKEGIKAQLKRNVMSGFNEDLQQVKLDVIYIDDATVRIKLSDADSNRFEPDIGIDPKSKPRSKELYAVDLTSDGVLTVKRKTEGTVVFKTKLSQLVFSNQFLQLSTYVSSHHLYGLGEHKEGIKKSFDWTRYTMFNQGDLPVPNRNLYGTHPFYLVLEPGGKANGLFLLNSNAMDAVLQPAPAVSWRSVGGILDFFVFLGPSPANVVQQYTAVVGRSFMVPYWSLGFHLCRYGYNTLETTNETLNRNLDAGVPIDVQWNDIDFMKRYLDFTYDPVNFSGLPDWVKELHEKGIHYIAMISPGVSNVEKLGSYPPYDDALKQDLFVKDADGNAIEAKVWNTNYTVFPDFTNPATPDYWAKQFERYYAELEFDGIWIDMNEPLNFMNGSLNGCPVNETEDPQYLPGRPYPLRTMTLCMTAKHHSTIHYNEHNLVAYREARATFNALKKVRNKRPFIISRASFSGQGVYSGHWSGDITSDWEDMRYTIPSMLIFNMYGMPMIGSDICGFRLNTSVELCTRWQALGAFYPFSRNHNDFDTTEQDPAFMKGDVLKATLDNLRIRYYLLPFFYTLFYRSHAYGDPTVRPLFFEFPDDENTFGINEEFLWGTSLLVVPALYEGKKEVNAYFPRGLWYDFHTGVSFNSLGVNRPLVINPTEIHLSVRGGFVIPLQTPGKTTRESRQNLFDLLIALDSEGKAIGELYWDDGDSLDTYENGVYNEIFFSAQNNSFKTKINKKGYDTPMNMLDVKVYGVKKSPVNVTVNGALALFEFQKPNLIIHMARFSLLDELDIVWNIF